MRIPALLLVSVLAGCLASPSADGPEDGDVPCGERPPAERTLWLGPDLSLLDEAPEAGSLPGNGFAEAFLTDDMDEWLSEPSGEGAWLEGDVVLEYWARGKGTPAPIVLGGDPGEGYHFFNQFGSDRSFQPAYAIEYDAVAPGPGTVAHYVETFTLPEGGFVVEKGDRVRLLLTSLVLDDAEGSGHDILFGGETASRITYLARCYPERSWTETGRQESTVDLVGNQGLLTGAVPPTEGVNTKTVPFTLDADTERLTVSIAQEGGTEPKDDIDLTIVGPDGDAWSIGSPYADESGTLWKANLDAYLPPGDHAVRVDSYSGKAYSGTLTIVQEE